MCAGNSWESRRIEDALVIDDLQIRPLFDPDLNLRGYHIGH